MFLVYFYTGEFFDDESRHTIRVESLDNITTESFMSDEPIVVHGLIEKWAYSHPHGEVRIALE